MSEAKLGGMDLSDALEVTRDLGSAPVSLRRPGRLMRVGQLAKATGKTVRTMHLYEELGLLRPVERSLGGFRLYAPEAKERISWICKLQSMGFALGEIQEFLRNWEASASAPAAMERVRAVFTQKLEETRSTLERLQELERDLSQSLTYLETCRTCAPSHLHQDCQCCSVHPEDTPAPPLVAGIHG